MLWWRVFQAGTLAWGLMVAAWTAVVHPGLLEVVAVVPAGTLVLSLAITPRGAWWRRRSGLDELSEDQREMLSRQWLLCAAVAFVAAFGIGLLRGLVGP